MQNPAGSLTSADLAGLRYVEDVTPGITRRRAGTGFTYRDADGKPIRARAEIARIRSITIPPAWSAVWICPNPRGHIQATGRDARGRKQYRYHPQWRTTRDETKFSRTADFGAALPGLRRQVRRDMARDGLPFERVAATIVRLLELALIRVGNDEYARANGSYGLTTMRARHVKVRGPKIRFSFVGKAGKEHEIDVEDVRAAQIVRRCRDLPGYPLFQWKDAEGARHTVGSADVNAYIREATGVDFSAKDFRTWGASLLMLRTLRAAAPAASERDAKRTLTEAFEVVASELGNTPALARASYVHPVIVEAYMDGSLDDRWARAARTSSAGRRSEEAAFVAFLRNAERASHARRSRSAA